MVVERMKKNYETGQGGENNTLRIFCPGTKIRLNKNSPNRGAFSSFFSHFRACSFIAGRRDVTRRGTTVP
jgi:hypothetical protein